jgi:hypothetical protein
MVAEGVVRQMTQLMPMEEMVVLGAGLELMVLALL